MLIFFKEFTLPCPTLHHTDELVSLREHPALTAGVAVSALCEVRIVISIFARHLVFLIVYYYARWMLILIKTQHR